MEVEELINWPSEDEVLKLDLRQDIAVGGVQAHLQLLTAGTDHILEELGISLLRNGLKFITQVAIIAVCAKRNAPAHAGIQLARMPPPLLERVAFEKFLIKLPTHLRNDNLLGIRGIFDWNSLLREPGFHLLGRRCAADELLEGVEIDGKVPIPTLSVREDFVIHCMPFRELREIFANPRRIRPEIMRPVGVNEHTMRVVMVVSVPSDVVALVHHQTTLAQLSCEPLGHG